MSIRRDPLDAQDETNSELMFARFNRHDDGYRAGPRSIKDRRESVAMQNIDGSGREKTRAACGETSSASVVSSRPETAEHRRGDRRPPSSRARVSSLRRRRGRDEDGRPVPLRRSAVGFVRRVLGSRG